MGHSEKEIMHVWSMPEVFIYFKVAQALLLKNRREELHDMRMAMNGSVEGTIKSLKEISERIEGLVGLTKKRKRKQKVVASAGLKLRLQGLGSKRKQNDGSDT